MPETEKYHCIRSLWMPKRYETAKTALTGAEIKAIANVAPNYQLFLERGGRQA